MPLIAAQEGSGRLRHHHRGSRDGGRITAGQLWTGMTTHTPRSDAHQGARGTGCGRDARAGPCGPGLPLPGRGATHSPGPGLLASLCGCFHAPSPARRLRHGPCSRADILTSLVFVSFLDISVQYISVSHSCISYPVPFL